jgi:hypothetical protein
MKNYLKSTSYIILFFTVILLNSCSKNESNNSNVSSNSIYLEFEAKVGSNTFELNRPYFVGPFNNKMVFSRFQYYISNVILTKEDGTTYIVPKDSSYYLITHNNNVLPKVELKNIPIGNYKSIQFMIGIDSISNLTIEPKLLPSALDPLNGMYWSWNSGYRFLVTEGTVQDSIAFKHHIGLQKNVKNLTFTSNTSAKVSSSVRPTMHFEVDVEKMYNGTEKINAVANRTIMVTPFASNVATNFPGMFILHHVHN